MSNTNSKTTAMKIDRNLLRKLDYLKVVIKERELKTYEDVVDFLFDEYSKNGKNENVKTLIKLFMEEQGNDS